MSITSRIISELKENKSLNDYKRVLINFLDKPHDEIYQILDSSPDQFSSLILMEIKNFDSYIFLDWLMEMWKTDLHFWTLSLNLLWRVIRDVSQSTKELGHTILKHYSKTLLENLDCEDLECRSRIAVVINFAQNMEVIDDEFIKTHETILMDKISRWRSDISQSHLINFIKSVFLVEIFRFDDFDYEIRRDFPNIAKNRYIWLEEQNNIKKSVLESQFEYSSANILLLIVRYENNWKPYLIKITFNKDIKQDWESLLEANPDDYRLYSVNLTLSNFWEWSESLFKYLKLISDDLTIDIDYRNVRFVKSDHISSSNFLHIEPDYAADYFLFNLFPMPSICGNYRLRIDMKAYENISEIIREYFNLEIEKASIIKPGSIFISLPVLHWRFKDISRSSNSWDVQLERAPDFSISDYDLYYIARDKDDNLLKKDVIHGSDLMDVNPIPVPLHTWKMTCFLDYQDKTVDTLKKIREEVKIQPFEIALKIVNDGLPIPDRIDQLAFINMIEFIKYNLELVEIVLAVETWLSPFNPSDIDKRQSSLLNLAIRFESFFKKLHEYNSDSGIKSSYLSHNRKNLTSILKQPWNIFNSQSWFIPYIRNNLVDSSTGLKIRDLSSATSSNELDDNWNVIIENRYNLHRFIQSMLLTVLLRNVSAHLSWSSIIWASYEPYHRSVRMILEMFILAWKNFT